MKNKEGIKMVQMDGTYYNAVRLVEIQKNLEKLLNDPEVYPIVAERILGDLIRKKLVRV